MLGEGPLRVGVASTCGNGWEATWQIYPDFAVLTVDRAPADYWFLYEGTPGGKLDDADFLVLSDGRRLPAAERWDDDIPGPEWLFFGDETAGRSLLLIHHEDDRAADAYYPMQQNMTVFGFGRRRLDKFLSGAPRRFTVGLYDATDHATIEPVAAGWLHPLDVRVGRAERRPGRARRRKTR